MALLAFVLVNDRFSPPFEGRGGASNTDGDAGGTRHS